MSEYSEILQKEIEAARRSAVGQIPAKTHQDLVVQNLGSGPEKESRFNQRLKNRQVAFLDNLINQFFQFRMLRNLEKDSIEITVKRNELEYDWRRHVTIFNSKGRKGYAPRKGVALKDHHTPGHGHPFVLLPEAFNEKVDYFVQLEKSQIAAARRKAEESIAAHWVKTNKHRLYKMFPVRWALYWLFSVFIKKYYFAKWNRYYRKHIYQE